MKFENTEVFNFEGALRGMRNPKESWNKSDSYYGNNEVGLESYVIGPNDLQLAQTLIRAGSEHRKFMRQIFVSVDITAPQYFWAEFDTYKVGTVRNSTSMQHKGVSHKYTIDDFEVDENVKEVLRVKEKEKLPLVYRYETEEISEMTGLSQSQISVIVRGVNDTSENKELFETCWYWEQTLNDLNILRDKYLETKDYKYFRMIRQLMPMGYLYKSTVTMDYENLLAICSKGQRRFHKLTEWSKSFIDWARTLPYAQELIFIDEYELKEEKEND